MGLDPKLRSTNAVLRTSKYLPMHVLLMDYRVDEETRGRVLEFVSVSPSCLHLRKSTNILF